MSKIVLLDQINLGDDLDFGPIAAFGEFKIYPFTEPEQVVDRCQEADIILVNKVKIERHHLEQLASGLKGICVCATGMDNIDVAYAQELGVAVFNVVGYGVESVAEHTLALYFSLSHHVFKFHNYVKSGQYSQQKSFSHLGQPFETLAHRKWGIIGLGAIGKQVANWVQALGGTIWYHSTSGNNTRSEFTHASLHELLTNCDVISIHCPLNEKTKNLLGEKELAMLKPGAYLINVARGEVIDTQALSKRLEQKNINVAIDVYSQEPPKKDDPLLAINDANLILTPHVAWAATSARKKLIEEVAINVGKILSRECI